MKIICVASNNLKPKELKFWKTFCELATIDYLMSD